MKQQNYYVCHCIERLREKRLIQKLTIEEIAQKLNVDLQTIIGWENSPNPDITLNDYAAYAQACNVSPLSIQLQCIGEIQ